MNTNTKQLRAVILAALMVLSVVAGTMALTGLAAADNRDQASGPDADLNNTSYVVFQGEALRADQILNNTDATVVEDYINSDDVELRLVDGEIPEDQPTGKYKIDGEASDFDVTVRTPSINDIAVNNENGQDVAGGGTLLNNDSGVEIVVDYDFRFAENITTSLESEVGGTTIDVTDRLITNTSVDGNVSNPYDDVRTSNSSEEATVTYVINRTC
jgi:surface glycoprotein (TIGR04207 family)